MNTDLDHLLCFAVYSTGHAFNRIYKPLLDKVGLTYPQYLVMVSLWSQDGQTVGSLGTSLHLESSTLTPLLKRLEMAGLVTRVRDAADERQVRVHLTAQGKKLAQAARGIPKCILEASGLSGAELGRLSAQLASLRDNLLTAAGKDAA